MRGILGSIWSTCRARSIGRSGATVRAWACLPIFHAIRRCARGNVSILSAFSFTVIVAGVALSVQLADLYAIRLRSQRTADLATLAAANTPNPIVNNAVSATATATASEVVAINGFGSSTVATTVGADGASLTTSISASANLLMGSVLSSAQTTTVGAVSTATVVPQTGSCLVSLGSYISIFGGASVQGSNCGVAAASYLLVSTASLTVNAVQVGFSQLLESFDVVLAYTLSPALGAFTFNASVTDTVGAKASVTAVKNHLAAMASWPYATSSPVSVSLPYVAWASDQSYSSGTTTIAQAAHIGNLNLSGNANLNFSGSGGPDASCTNPTTVSGQVISSGTSTLTLSSGCYVFAGAVTNSGTGTLTFALASGATVTLIFESYIQNSQWGTMTFPDATYSIAGNVNNNSGGSITFGNGRKVFGAGIWNSSGYVTLNNGPFYFTSTNINQNTGTMRFGNGPFYFFWGAVTNGASGTMTFGTGPFYFYGTTLNAGNGVGCPLTQFAGGPYYFWAANLNAPYCSTTNIGPGNMDFYAFGSVNFSGTLLQFGWNGSATSGSSLVSFYGGSIYHTAGTFAANGVTFATNFGNFFMSGSGMNVTAPTSASPSYGYTNLAFVTTNGAVNVGLTGTPTATISGMIYAPQSYANFVMPQTISGGTGGCFGIFANYINISTSSTLKLSPCSGMTSSSSSSKLPSLQ